MHIDIINNVSLTNAGQGLEKSVKADKTAQKRSDAADATVRSQYASVISRALAQDDMDQEAIQQAENALAAGQLDTPKAAKATAEYILKFGI